MTQYYITQHQDVLQKVRQEIDAVLFIDDEEEEGSYQSSSNIDLSQFKYLKCVLQETLRLKPSAPVRGRTLTETDELGGYTLKAGSDIAYERLPMAQLQIVVQVIRADTGCVLM
jgi:cytochrome P450